MSLAQSTIPGGKSTFLGGLFPSAVSPTAQIFQDRAGGKMQVLRLAKQSTLPGEHGERTRSRKTKLGPETLERSPGSDNKRAEAPPGQLHSRLSALSSPHLRVTSPPAHQLWPLMYSGSLGNGCLQPSSLLALPYASHYFKSDITVSDAHSSFPLD